MTPVSKQSKIMHVNIRWYVSYWVWAFCSYVLLSCCRKNAQTRVVISKKVSVGKRCEKGNLLEMQNFIQTLAFVHLIWTHSLNSWLLKTQFTSDPVAVHLVQAENTKDFTFVTLTFFCILLKSTFLRIFNWNLFPKTLFSTLIDYNILPTEYDTM